MNTDTDPTLMLQLLQKEIDSGAYRNWTADYHKAFFAKLMQQLRDAGMDHVGVIAIIEEVLK